MNNDQLLMGEIGLICIILVLKRRQQLIQRRKLKKRQLWTRKWLQRRNEGRGIDNLVFKELKFEDTNSFKNFTRMSVNSFENLLQKVEPIISKQNTILRESIPARSR